MHAKSLQLCDVRLCNPMDCSSPASSVHGILQARILQWVANSSSRVSSGPRDQTCLSLFFCIGRQVLYHQCRLGSPLKEWANHPSNMTSGHTATLTLYKEPTHSLPPGVNKANCYLFSLSSVCLNFLSDLLSISIDQASQEHRLVSIIRYFFLHHQKLLSHFSGLLQQHWLALFFHRHIMHLKSWLQFFLLRVCVCVCPSVMCDCSQLHGLQPARLLYPWNPPGKNTGVVTIAFSRGSSPPKD